MLDLLVLGVPFLLLLLLVLFCLLQTSLTRVSVVVFCWVGP
jgi:hypothetical protein